MRWNDRLARRERIEAEAVRTRLEKAPGKLFGLNAPLLSYEAIAKHSIQRLAHVKNSKLHAVAAPSTVTISPLDGRSGLRKCTEPPLCSTR